MVRKQSPSGDLSHLTEDERRALRGSKFTPLPSNNLPSSCSQQQHQPRLAHPGGPMTTNKAAALAKFLERKLQQPGGLDSIKPELLELAVRNAKEAVNAGGSSGTIVRHVASFDDSSEESNEALQGEEHLVLDKKKKKKKKKKQSKLDNMSDEPKSKQKKRKEVEDSESSNPKKLKKNKKKKKQK